MLNERKSKYGEWYKNINKEEHYLVLSDDLDSYLSCLFLQKKFGVEIGGFYDFKRLYINSEKTKGKTPIYVDADVRSGLAFGNHVTALRNKDCVNLNSCIDVDNYYEKYAGSTLMTLYSLYDVDLRKYKSRKVALLLLVDVWFKQYFRYRSKWDKWVRVMEMEYLSDIFEELELTEDDCYNALVYYCMNDKISIKKDGTLATMIDFDGIKENFGLKIPKPDNLVFDTLVHTFQIKCTDVYTTVKNKEVVFSNAMTFKNKVRYSY